MSVAEGTFVELFMTLLKEWLSLTKDRQRDLLRLCNVKFQELQVTHEEFMRSLDELLDIVQRARHHGAGNNADPLAEVALIERRRREGRQMRLARYQEAKVYAEETFINDTRVYKTVPQAIIDTVRTTMRSYVAYFSRDHKYDHDLGHAIREVARYLQLAHESGSADSHEVVLGRALEEVREARRSAEFSWLQFTRDYTRAYAAFADNGVYLAENIPPPSKPSAT